MASKLPTQLATARSLDSRGHHSKPKPSSLSWRTTLSSNGVVPSPLTSSNLSFNGLPKRSVLPVVRCSGAAVNLGPGTPVRSTSVLVVGATGTLGRQVVRRALDEGYDVRCLVRPRPAPADFLRDWGAIVVNADLTKPETIPATLVGIHTVIDCATGRPEEPIKTVGCFAILGFQSTDMLSGEGSLGRSSSFETCVLLNFWFYRFSGSEDTCPCNISCPSHLGLSLVDWEGKVALIQCAKAMGIQKYVFFSIHNCDNHPEVYFTQIEVLASAYNLVTENGCTICDISGSTNACCQCVQGLIGQYAVPILEEKSVWGTDATTRIAYMDTQDIARLTFIALRNEKINGKLLTFAGPRAWTTQEVITLCERLAGQDANVTTVPVSVLKLTRQLTRLFEWTNDVADRLAFSEVLTSDTVFSTSMTETYDLLGVDPKDIVTLEKYLQDYFTNILKKLKDLKAQSKQSDFYI
ncbi:Uncharacterized protein ycf39 [Vitis vinifera]|uniref:Uncharacterized protein ycf39 n=1 Tax=Vitis vinifera TaxID=29760 RepID=A0A438JT11_VITVI|nr:Uncharacterized protein ycf39 [Vitis vinifera]